MSWRLCALAMLLLAAGLYWGAARPFERRALTAADAYAHARDERQLVRTRLRAVEARLESAKRAQAPLGTSGEEAVRHVRRAMVEALDGTRVRDVRLGVRADKTEVDVRVALSGSAPDVLEAAGRVARPGTGVVLDRVALNRQKAGIAMDLAGVAALAEAGPR